MLQCKAFKFRLKPYPKQVQRLSQTVGCCRWVWNQALALQKEQLDQGHGPLNYPKLAEHLVQWKHDLATAFLKAVHSQPLQQTLMNLDRAIKDALNKSNPKQFPRFKKKNRHNSFRYPQGFKLDEMNNRIYLPKIGWVRYYNSRKVEGLPKNVTLSCEIGHWYISIQTEEQVESPAHTSESVVGGDLGIAKFLTLSDGSVYLPLNSFRHREKKLACLQKQLSRKVKFSHNWQRQRKQIARLHHEIACMRQDFLHKISSTLSKNHAIVVLEDLNVSGMSASASGTVDEPGKRVKAKSGLNKSILDQGWSEFRRQLEYKISWLGGKLMVVPAAYTSQKCSQCGHTCAENRKSQALFSCQLCGYTDNADVNAAKNILAAGQAVIACGGSGTSPPLKQEPAEQVATCVAS